MQKPRIAAVSYLNALPLIWGLARGRDSRDFHMTLHPPHECSRLLREGLVDVALIPSIEFAQIGGLSTVPGLGISSRREVRSVVLISRKPLERIRRLAVDDNSRTSVALARLILARGHNCRPRIEAMAPELEPMLRDNDAALLIGDAALKETMALGDRVSGSRPELQVLDLAREWNLLTSKPFVFAFWACRPVVNGSEIGPALERSLEEGMANLESIVSDASSRIGLPAEEIRSYLTRNIHYRLGREEVDSLRVFYRMSWEDGILSEQHEAKEAAGA